MSMTAGRPPVTPAPSDGSSVGGGGWFTWAVVGAFVASLAYFLSRPGAGEVFAALSTIGMTVIWAAAWSVAAYGAGRSLARWMAAGESWGWVEPVIASIAGAGVLVAVAFLLSLVGWFRPWPLLIALAVFVAFGTRSLIRDPVDGVKIRGWALPLAGLGGIALLVAATVSPFYDQWHQHLGFTWIWIHDGSVHSLPRNWYSYMPVNSSLLFGYGLGTLGAWSAQVIHWWSGVVTIFAVGALAERVGPRGGAVWAVWILGTSPTMLHLATTAGSDLVIAMFTAGAWLALLRAEASVGQGWRWWVFSGACVGLSVGTKYVALGTVVLPIVAGVVVLFRPWRDRTMSARMLRGSALATGAALLVYAPWGIRNLVETGNPLFPFVNGVFRGILRVPVATAERFDLWMSGLDLSPAHLVEGLDLGTFRHSMDGFPSVGIAFVGLAVVALLSWRRLPRPATPALGAAILVGTGFWVATMHANRYLVPVLVTASVVLGSAVARTLTVTRGVVRTSLAVLLGVALVWNVGASVSALGMERLGCTFGVFPLEPILYRLVSSYPAFAAVASLPEDSKILLVAESRALGFERPVELEHPFGEPRLEELARLSTSPREMAARLADDGFTHLLANSWEAPRIAGMNKRKRYFGGADRETADRLDAFCRQCLDPVWADRGLWLFRIDPTCSVPPPGGAGLADW